MTTTPSNLAAARFEEPTFPFPPRFRWLKRGTILVLLVIGGLVLLRLWWGHIATVRTRELVEAAHARGEPILPEDFVSAAIPDSQNAAVSLSLAASAVYRDQKFDDFDNDFVSDLLSPADMAEVGRIVALNQRAFELCHRARSQNEVDWKIPISHPMVGIFFTNLRSQRQLANMEKYAILYDHAKHNDHDAIECLRDVLRQSDTMDWGPSENMTHWLADAIDESAFEVIEHITPTLQIYGSGGGGTHASRATPEQIRALIHDLLSEDQCRRGVVHAWHGEGMYAIDLSDVLARGQGVAGIPNDKSIWFVSPMVRLDGVRTAMRDAQFSIAAAQLYWPSVKANCPARRDSDASELEMMTEIYGLLIASYGERSLLLHFQIFGERRALAIELALHLYRAEHDGRLPETLAELVPEYLSRIPDDPMASGSQPMKYRPHAMPPVIYSVGHNGIDDGGTSLPDGSISGGRWTLPDAVWPLEPVAASTQPSSQTQNNQ